MQHLRKAIEEQGMDYDEWLDNYIKNNETSKDAAVASLKEGSMQEFCKKHKLPVDKVKELSKELGLEW